MNLHKSTVHQIVFTLEYKEILEKNPDTSKYMLGINLYKIGILARDEDEIISISLPHLKKLTEIFGETSNLVVMVGYECVYIAQQTTNKMIRMFIKIGARVLPHCTGAGKVLLSEMDEKEIDRIISKNGLPSYTKNTTTKKEELKEALRKVRAEGYGIDNEEREEGVMCIAAPVRDRSKKIVAAISISGPRYRFDGLNFKELVAALIKAKLQQFPRD